MCLEIKTLDEAAGPEARGFFTVTPSCRLHTVTGEKLEKSWN